MLILNQQSTITSKFSPPSRTFRSIFRLFLLSLCVLGVGSASAAVGPGDIAVVGFNSDAPDGFAIVMLADIGAGEVIFISDDGWETPGFGDDFNDWVIKWTIDGDGIPAGTVLDNTTLTTQGTVAFETGINLASSINLNASGDCVLIYQTSTNNYDASGGTVTFVYGFNNNNFNAVNGWNNSNSASTSSHAPTGLTVVATSGGAGEAFGLHNESDDNYVYSGPTTAADKATWLSRIHTIGNWSKSPSVNQNISPGGVLPVTITVPVELMQFSVE